MKCLITQLFGSVNDESFPKFDILKINIEKRESDITTPEQRNLSFIINVVEPTLLKAYGSGWFSVTSFSDVDNDKLREYLIPADTDTTVYCKWDNFYLETKAHAIKKFRTGNYTNLDSPNNTIPSCIAPVLGEPMPNLTDIKCIYSNLTGNINGLYYAENLKGHVVLTPNNGIKYYANKTSLSGKVTSFRSPYIQGIHMSGTTLDSTDEANGYYGLSYLGSLVGIGTAELYPGVSELSFRNSGASGRIEKFVEFAVDNNHIEELDGLEVMRIFIVFSFFGKRSEFNKSMHNRLYWSGKDRIWVIGRDSTELSSANKVWAYGCTQEQISEWETQGMTVTIVTKPDSY